MGRGGGGKGNKNGGNGGWQNWGGKGGGGAWNGYGAGGWNNGSAAGDVSSALGVLGRRYQEQAFLDAMGPMAASLLPSITPATGGWGQPVMNPLGTGVAGLPGLGVYRPPAAAAAAPPAPTTADAGVTSVIERLLAATTSMEARLNSVQQAQQQQQAQYQQQYGHQQHQSQPQQQPQQQQQ